MLDIWSWTSQAHVVHGSRSFGASVLPPVDKGAGWMWTVSEGRIIASGFAPTEEKARAIVEHVIQCAIDDPGE